MNIKLNKKYELAYWERTKQSNIGIERANRSLEVLKINFTQTDIVADIGCGPYAGIFIAKQCNTMYAVDPLWSIYDKQQICSKLPKGIIKIINDAENFTLPQKADSIISVNALDHSGNLSQSITNIFSNLKSNGLFYLHIHLRKTEQLNAGHKLALNEETLDKLLCEYITLVKQIYPRCPIENKPYKTYVAIIKNNN